jgi:cell wall-associated NlpC family hydrolase
MTDLTEVLDYARTFLGVRYGAWDGETIPRDDSTPFYACNGPPPDMELVTAQGVSCTGFTNILRRFCGLSIPGVFDPLEEYPGGTGAWRRFLLPSLRPFRDAERAAYPVGALLIRPYHDFEDQGHVAVIIGPGLVIHSFPDGPGVAITPILAGYYTGWVPAEVWLGASN